MRPARNALSSFIFFLASALALLPALLPLACGGGGTATETDTAAARSTPEPEEAPAAADGSEGSGWRWKGKRQDCFFRFGDHCYDKLEAACRAARCSEAKCAHDSGAPAVVTCRR